MSRNLLTAGWLFSPAPFTLFCCSCVQTRGWKPLLASVYHTTSCNTIQRHSTWANKARAMGLLLQTYLLPCQMHMEYKPKLCSGHSIFLLLLFPPTPPPSITVSKACRAAAKVHREGNELPPVHFLDGWIWMLLLVCPPEVKESQIPCQMTPASCSLPIPLAVQHSYGPEEHISTRGTWSSRYLCCFSWARESIAAPQPQVSIGHTLPLAKTCALST